jgi:predicted transcriptional regulator of viral defense system
MCTTALHPAFWISFRLQKHLMIDSFCKLKLMKSYLDSHIESILASGRFFFTREELRQKVDASDPAIQQCLTRFSRKKLIRSVRNGFYVIIPPEHRSKGLLPPEMFIDEFMRYLNRPYYAGLLSAAALHGAGHQQPQTFSVITARPPIRPILYKNLKIFFPVKSEMPQTGIEQKKTPSGYINVSSPELTALDLMTYLKQSGGLPAVTSVLEELIELMTPEKVKQTVSSSFPSTALQRLGFVLDEVFTQSELADSLYNELLTRKFFHIPLNPADSKGSNPINKRWKISVNTDLETQL